MNYYILSLRLDNWNVLQKNEYSFLAFSKRNLKRIKKVNNGDKIIIYIGSRISTFSAILEIVDNNIIFNDKLIWDDIYPFQLKTKPFFLMQDYNKLKVKEIANELNFIKNKEMYGRHFQLSLRNIDDITYNIIYAQMVSKDNQS